MSDGSAVRVAAARTLDAVLAGGRSLKAALAQHLPALADARDRALLEAIVFAALRQHARFDAALGAWLAKPLGARDQPLRALLHAGFAQLELGLPAHAALASTVEAARRMGRPHQAGLVNAVLRRAQREGLPVAPADAGWPRWLAAKVRADWPADADAVFAESARAAPMWLRVNRRVASRDAWLEDARAAGIAGEGVPGLADAVRLGGCRGGHGFFLVVGWQLGWLDSPVAASAGSSGWPQTEQASGALGALTPGDSLYARV